MTHNVQPKIAMINDISGFGRCSITVSLPVISQLQVQCCPLPTSIFSNHTGYDSFYMEDFTHQMVPYIEEWQKLNLHFDGICTGFLSSVEQIDIVSSFIRSFKARDTIVIVDPVMGDDGAPYSTYTDEMCQKMAELVRHADIITPNLTEACILTGTPYHAGCTLREIRQIAEKLAGLGPSRIVITGISQKRYIANLVYVKDTGFCIRRTHCIGTERAGTGDIFSAIIAADAVNRVPFADSVSRASAFIKRCVSESIARNVPVTDGVCFEEILHTLRPKRNRI